MTKLQMGTKLKWILGNRMCQNKNPLPGSWLVYYPILYLETVTAVLYLGVLALAATQQYFLLSEVAVRILPALCQLTINPEKSVRDNVFRAIKGYLGKLEKVSEDPTLRESMGKCRRMKYTESGTYK